MKSALFFALFLCYISASYAINLNQVLVRANSSVSCESTFTCATEGDKCNVTGCSLGNGDCCANGLSCKNSTCYTDNIDEYCKTSADCFSNYDFFPFTARYACVNNSCTIQYFPGDECEYDTDCVSGQCSDSVCAGSNTTCMNQYDCDYGYECIQKTCVAQGMNNSACTITDQYSCAVGYTCNPSTKKCMEPYSLGVDDSCSSGYINQCGEDLVCYKGKCQDGDEWDQVSCDEDSDCPTNQYCYCSKASGDQFCLPNITNAHNFTNDHSSLYDYYECLRENNCSSQSTAPNSCAQQECSSDYSDSIEFECDVSDSIFDSCFANDNCGGFPLWAIILIAVVAVILVLGIIVVIVMVVRSKQSRQYDRIE